jgi:hypothetical protein
MNFNQGGTGPSRVENTLTLTNLGCMAKPIAANKNGEIRRPYGEDVSKRRKRYRRDAERAEVRGEAQCLEELKPPPPAETRAARRGG